MAAVGFMRFILVVADVHFFHSDFSEICEVAADGIDVQPECDLRDDASTSYRGSKD